MLWMLNLIYIFEAVIIKILQLLFYYDTIVPFFIVIYSLPVFTSVDCSNICIHVALYTRPVRTVQCEAKGHSVP